MHNEENFEVFYDGEWRRVIKKDTDDMGDLWLDLEDGERVLACLLEKKDFRPIWNRDLETSTILDISLNDINAEYVRVRDQLDFIARMEDVTRTVNIKFGEDGELSKKIRSLMWEHYSNILTKGDQ